jgi:hypothetical protein
VESDELPRLSLPIGIMGMLPKNLIYYDIKKNDFFKPSTTVLFIISNDSFIAIVYRLAPRRIDKL